MHDTVDTFRLHLRPVSHGDRDALIDANRANRNRHRPWATPPTDAAGFDAWFERCVRGPKAVLVARDRADRGVVGVVSLTAIDLGPLRRAYLGFHGYAPYDGRGLMTEAVRGALGHGFDRLGLRRIEANVQPANARSVALVRRLGFRAEGHATDYLSIDGWPRPHDRWALLDREFRLPGGTAPATGSPVPDEAVDMFWHRFRAATGLGDARPARAFAFGDTPADADALARLVARRRKRATASRRAEYARDRERVPAPGDLSVVVDARGAPVCVIRTTEVRLGPLASVDDAFAWDEGEDDRTRASWLRVHRAFFARAAASTDDPFDPDATDTVFERFATIWPDIDGAFPG